MMRASRFLLVAGIAGIPWFSPAGLCADPPPQANSGQPPAANACPPGTHWEPAGYVHDGKWRDARCAKDGGRE